MAQTPAGYWLVPGTAGVDLATVAVNGYRHQTGIRRAGFFRQRRTGLLNREFEIIKFRSMYQDAERMAHAGRHSMISG